MLCEQSEAIRTGHSKIARMKLSQSSQSNHNNNTRSSSSNVEYSKVIEECHEMFGGTSTKLS